MTGGADTVLIVEPDNALRVRLVRLLAKQGYKVAGVSDAEGALNTLSGDPICLTVMALDLPGMDGHALMSAMEERGHLTPVVVMAGGASIQDAVAAMQKGAVNLLSKPFDDESFLGAVVSALVSTEARSGMHRAISIEEVEAMERAESTAPPASSPEPDPLVAPALHRAVTSGLPPAIDPDLPKASADAVKHVAEELRSGSLNLPAVPAVILELRGMLDDPNKTLAGVAPVINKDQELVMRILTKANAAAYGGAGNICHVGTAVVRLGARMVLAIATKVMTERLCNSLRNPHLEDLASCLWERTVRVASATRMIAEVGDLGDPEQFYLSTLLSELGEPFLISYIDEVLQGQAGKSSMGAIRREIARLHPQFGEALLNRWKMEEISVFVARHHHDTAKMRELVSMGDTRARILYAIDLARQVVGDAGLLPPSMTYVEARAADEETCLKILLMKRRHLEGVVKELKEEFH